MVYQSVAQKHGRRSLYRRTAVEHIDAYLKGFFQLNNMWYRIGKRAKVHSDLLVLVYNASKLAADRIGARLHQVQAA